MGNMDETRTKVLQNGAIYDLDQKRIIAMRPELAVRNTQITQATAGDLQARRVQSKRDALARGAQRVLEASSGIPATSDLAFVEAIGAALMQSAQDPDNRQQVRAAELLIRETGLSERLEAPSAGGNGQAAEIITALAQFAAAILPSGEPVQVIDADGFDNYNYRNHDTDAQPQPPTGDTGTDGTG